MIILLTGGSSGFGFLAMRQMLDQGHRVLAAVRGGEPRLKQLLGTDWDRYAPSLVAVDLSLDQPDSFRGVKELIDREFGGKLDVLVNNAGYGLMGPAEDQTEQQLRHQLEVNFFAPALLTRELLDPIRKAQGRIINVSSICGLLTYPFYGAYCASKHALEAYTETLRHELEPFGVQVGLVEPGSFRTSFNRAVEFSEKSLQPSSLYYQRSKAYRQWLIDKGKFGGDPQKVAQLIVRLCESPRIPVRVVVGKDAKLMAFLARVLPSKTVYALIRWIFRKSVFRD